MRESDVRGESSGESSGEMSENDKQKINYYGIASSFIYISIIFLIGVPLWWTTTSPSRHSLPDVSSLLVASQMIAHKFPVYLVPIDEDIDREELRSQLVNNWPQRFSSDGSLAYDYVWEVRRPLEREEQLFRKYSEHKSLLDIDNELTGIEGHETKGKLWVFILASNSSLIPSDKTHIFGRNRFFYLKNDENSFASKSLAEVIVDLVDTTQVLSDKSYVSQRLDFLLYPQIDLIVNVVTENEEQKQLIRQKVDEIHRIGDYGLIKESGVSELIRFELNSQVLHYVFDNRFISSHLKQNNETNERLFDVSDVSLLMNTIESRVVEHNNKQSYHLLVYIPSDKPLLFYDSKAKTKSNLMVTPFRGGVLIWNKDNDFVNGFRAIIRNLIALPNNIPSNLVTNELFFA